jgi:uncharacterized damage-inducible protein DinB
MRLAETLLPEFDREMDATRRVLARVTDEKLDWRPHPKSWTMGELASHLANLVRWGALTLQGEEFDLGGFSPFRGPFDSRQEILVAFDAHLAEARPLLVEAGDDRLTAAWTLRNGTHTILCLPRLEVLRYVLLSHSIHHRGQMTVYLRLCDLPVPRVYGSSADEA